MSDVATRLSHVLADRYRVERELGVGGMATVYLAHDLRHDRKVALKVLHPDLAATIGPERFLSEIRVTANLQHPNILGLFDSGVAEGQAFYVMPYVDGESLRDRLNRERQLPVTDALRITTGVAAALDYAHAHGVIHRDIKPENILLQSGQAVVADFGIALAVQQAGGQRITQTGLSLGTPQYMSPEQAMGERTLDARTDIYALGVIAYEMLAGEPPFSGPNAQAIVSRVLTEKPRPLTLLRDTVPPHVEVAVHRALQKLPADRFASAAAFAAALESTASVAGPATIGVRAGSRGAIGRPWRRWTVAAIAAIAILSSGYFMGRRVDPAAEFPTEWHGELLGGPRVAMIPVLSHDGQMVAFQTLTDGQSQLAVLKPQSGDWKQLTESRSRGIVSFYSWARDDSRIYFDRFIDVPNGVYSVSPLGGEERLVLADAGFPDVLPDGSLLVGRLNADRNMQMYRFWPETGRIDTIAAIGDATQLAQFFRALPNGKEAVFIGRPADQKDSTRHLYVIDLETDRVRRLAWDPDGWSTFSFTPDGRWLVFASQAGPTQQVIAVPTDGSHGSRILATLTSTVFGVDVAADGSIYFDQIDRPMQLRRFSPATRRAEDKPIQSLSTATSPLLPLPDGRVLVSALSGSATRVLVVAPGGEATPFMATLEQTGPPLASLGRDRVAMSIGAGANRGVVIASIATGQLVKRLPGLAPVSMAGSPDGKTLYFSRARAIWAMSSDGGVARRIRDGDAVAADPNGRYLVIQFDDVSRVRLFRVPLDGAPESEIAIRGENRLAFGIYLPSNAVGADGRIVVGVVAPGSWFWPSAILDPATGLTTLIPPGVSADMRSGWGVDGDIVYYSMDMKSALWRFRPAPSTPGGT